MAEKPSDKPSVPAKKQALDLNALSGLDFGPNWADENKAQTRKSSGSRDEPKSRHARSGMHRDRRPSGNRSSTGGGRTLGGGHGEGRPPRGPESRGRRSQNERGRPPAREFFQPTVAVDLYPQDEAFEALVKRLRATARTYQLFEIAHLLLEKPERYVVVVSNKPANKGEPVKPLFYSVIGHLPFESEDAALNHVMTNHLDQFFDIEAIEVDPPKGNFQMVNRCGITGELLGPPNYHRYQEFLQRHYNTRITGMSFDRFVSKIETVKEQEQIDAWVESMKKGARYTVKDHSEGEPESVESLEAVRHFLLQHRKDKVVGSGDSIRFAGRDIQHLPQGDIRRSVEAYVEQQLHFPLDAANNIRGRLRRHKFTVYKKGSKGVSYVCAVKRKFREAGSSFTDSIRHLIEFIESNPNTPASKLPKLYIGIDTEKQKPEVLAVTEAEVAAAAAAKQVAEAEKEKEAATQAEPAPEASTPVGAAPDAAASTDATPTAALSEEEQKRLNQLMLDLRWLITEGYVTEYGDGRLFAPPPMPEPKKKDIPPAPAKDAVSSDVPAKESVVEDVLDMPVSTMDEGAPAEGIQPGASASIPVDKAEPEVEAKDEPKS